MSSSPNRPCSLTPAGPFLELREPVHMREEECEQICGVWCLCGLSEEASVSAYCRPIPLEIEVLSSEHQEGDQHLDALSSELFHFLFIVDAPASGKTTKDPPSQHCESHTVEIHCTLNSTDWRVPGVQKLALLATGRVFGRYRELIGSCDRWCYHDQVRGCSAGVVFLRDWGCILCFTRSRLVRVHWLTREDYIPRSPTTMPVVFLGVRLHGLRQVHQLDGFEVRNSLCTVAIGWQLRLGGWPRPHITLAWTLGKTASSSSDAFVPKSCIRLGKLDGPLTFQITSKWSSGGGYNLSASHHIADCIDTTRFPMRNDGGSPGSTAWWHISGEALQLEELCSEAPSQRWVPGDFSVETLEFY
ncbi:Uncharacterized protein SCF082_LOCUS14451 [Durusdinium trenchii]|uniref:Uncharacterized protein n=1 Tax=Durusdinium trenchii TaxID=1381693 RepID=A0ABP0JZ91_9DINO